jgi:hypothetical protein
VTQLNLADFADNRDDVSKLTDAEREVYVTFEQGDSAVRDLARERERERPAARYGRQPAEARETSPRRSRPGGVLDVVICTVCGEQSDPIYRCTVSGADIVDRSRRNDRRR